jgi:hypothetical protein
MKKHKNITFKVWLEIERLNEKTGKGEDMDAPGGSLASFETYEEARDYAEHVTRLAAAASAEALMLDLIRYGLMSLEDGEAEFDDVMYWFDDQNPDWTAVIEAIGWDTARAAIARAMTAQED